MGTIQIFDVEKGDFFRAMSLGQSLQINDNIHVEVMKRNNITTIISYDKDFDAIKKITREEP